MKPISELLEYVQHDKEYLKELISELNRILESWENENEQSTKYNRF